MEGGLLPTATADIRAGASARAAEDPGFARVLEHGRQGEGGKEGRDG